VISLDALALHFGTDKASGQHNYCHIYDSLFAPWRALPITMLELGVAYGSSLQMWAAYFANPGAIIHGIDCNDYDLCGLPKNTVVHCCDQTEKPDGWVDIPLDIVVDDASHEYAKTAASFRLWWPSLRPGGYYVVEDTSPQDNTFLKNLVDEVNQPDLYDIEWLIFRHDLCIARKTALP
jgi:cephalosporin hydroxylase